MQLTLAALLCAAAPAAAQELSVADRYAPGDESHWRLTAAGADLGHTWSRYEGEVELAGLRAHHFVAQARLTTQVPGGTLDQRYLTELWTDAHGHPLRVEFLAAVSDMASGVELVCAGGQAQAVIRQGGSERSLEIDVPAQSFVLANNFLSHLELVLALAPPEVGEKQTYSMLSVNALRTFPLTVELVKQDEAGAHLEDSLGEASIMKGGRLQRLEVRAQGVVFARTDAPVERVTIDLPGPEKLDLMAGLEREDVVIAYDDVSLAGTITRRMDTTGAATGRLPAIFFVSGSGGQDRQGFASGIDVGTHELLDRLTNEGYLVLRVDDRGVGGSTGPTVDMTFDDLVEDARRCVAFLRTRDDVDPARIAVIGHSEGGQTAPILAAEGGLAAIVLMAAPGRGILELSHEQFLRGKRLEGASEQELEAFSQAIRDFFAKVIADEPVEADALPAELQPFVGARGWLRSHAEQDPAQNLARVVCPVLVLQGEKDIQVSARRDTAALEQALAAAGNADFEVVLFPDLDHLFKRSEEEVPTGLEYLRERPLDAAFLDTVAAWLNAHLQPSGD